MKRKSPKIASGLLRTELSSVLPEAVETGNAVEDRLFERDAPEIDEPEQLSFSGCVFRRVSFAELKTSRIDFTDCRFEYCDFPGFRFADGLLARCEFIGCRATGATLSAMTVRDVLWQECRLNCFSVSDCSLERTEFSNCDMDGLMLYASRQKELVLSRCSLRSAEISGTSLSGVDLSDCGLDGIIAHPDSLRGATVGVFQSPAILPIFGINVKL